ncbi:unnamed protein product [Adineta ricciae]|uniref:TRAF1-6 MATH domain-containing protein n=1 Tax=Adineta ricciae TaxID=249248 RepID=A0A815UT13_ADIRI|nr:unnamed protein product [Adineta ricciae]
MQEILLLNTDRTDVSSKRQIIEAKLSELRDNFKRFNELLTDIFKTIEIIHQTFNEMYQLKKNIQAKRSSSAHTIDMNNTYVLKVALLVILNDGSIPVNSGPIQTSNFGYRFAMIVTSGIHEHSKTPSMHVSWVICRGEFDPVLTWPFPYPIKISLMDLSGEQKHISHLINPDSNPQSSIFQSPKNTTNLPYEIPQFCTMDKLVRDNSKFVRDGNIFIELQVDFNEK